MTVARGLQTLVLYLVLSVSSAAREPVLYNSIPGCRSNVHLDPGNIIDIRASVERGAELLTGRYETSLVSCIASCCNLLECDLVLYKNVGVSQSGKNCYFIRCGSSDNCVMVSHEGFTSVITGVYADGSVATTMDSGATTSPSSQLSTSSESLGTTTPTSATISLTTSNKTTTTTAAATTMTTTAPTTTAAVSDTTHLVPVTSIPNATTSGTSASTILPSSHHGGEGETTSDPVITTEGNSENEGGGGKGEGNVTDLHKADNLSQLGNIADTNPGNIIRAEDDCSHDGCDGSGVIAVAVVGSICFLIIVVVVAIVLKRIASDKRKKRFRNVDYLINGMYT